MIVTSDVTIINPCNEDITVINGSCLKVLGMINGNISVEENSNLIVNGFVVGNITINQNATANIHGTVNGSVLNYGKLSVFGVIQNLHNFSGELTIDSKAIIRNHY